MIDVRQVSKQFGNTAAVSEVSFTVLERETLVILGSSGSGKTTLLKMLNRLTEPDTGEVWINGSNIRKQQPEALRRNIGYVIQQAGLFPHYTVAENIGIVPELLKWPASKIKDRTHQLLQTLGLPPAQFAHRYPHQLSGGQQQRVGLARALAANPPVLLMDEPFGALDPVIRHSIRQEFLHLDELKDKTTILVTHDVTEAVLLASRILLMDSGQVQQMGTPKELLLQPANAIVKDFFGHNRFQLERMVISLNDLLPHLTLIQPNTENIPVFDSSENVWQVMDKLQHIATDFAGIRKENQVYYAPASEIMGFKSRSLMQ